MTSTTTRRFTIHLAINRPDCAMSARYDGVAGQDADHAVALAVTAAEREFDVTGWLLDAVAEEPTICEHGTPSHNARGHRTPCSPCEDGRTLAESAPQMTRVTFGWDCYRDFPDRDEAFTFAADMIETPARSTLVNEVCVLDLNAPPRWFGAFEVIGSATREVVKS